MDRRACLAGAMALPILAAGRAQGTPSLVLEILSPPEAVPSGGRTVAIYELSLWNFGSATIQLDRVSIRDPGGSELMAVSGADLAARFDAPGPGGGPGMLPYGHIGTLYLEVPLPSPVPASLTHLIAYREAGRPSMLAAAPVRFDTTPIPTLAAPLAGGPWVAVHAPEWPRGHRRVTYTIGRTRIPGRLAIDFVRVDAEGRIARDDADKPANTLGYGAEVLAVADARIAATREGMAESPSVARNPGHASADAAGNFVSLDLGRGRFAVYEHLRPGSIRVKKGERVRCGQPIAALGFTGDSTGPHLHFHVADSPLPLLGEGKAFVFEAYEQLGAYPDIALLGTSPWRATPRDGTRLGEWPESNCVIRFR